MDIGVLTVVVAILAVLALIAWYRVMTRYHDVEGRGLRMFGAVVVSLIAASSLYVETAHHQRQHLATEAIEVLSEVHGASANCERATEDLLNARSFQGYVYYDGSNVAHLRRTVCHQLWDYAHGGQAHPTVEEILAVHIVAHESQHINGITSESAAECRAVQLNHLVAEALGATPEEARELQRRYYVDLYPNQRSNYVSGACVEGGELDIFADRTEFP